MNGNLLRTLNEIEVDDLTLVGAKALHLALLNGNRLTTPPGLVVTSQFFKAQISHYAYQPIWAGSPDVAVTEGALHFLADFLKSNPLAPPLEAALQQRLCELFPPEVQFFAVRSSAIDEDRRDHSFAGCYLSELGVPRQMLTVSLTRCWASALTGRAIEYRLKRGLSIQAITTAVLIQPMLRPDAAGVAFTLNPVTGARDELVIEAAAGLGDAIAGGRMNPYRYRLARQSPDFKLIERTAGETAGPNRDPLSGRQLVELAQTLEQVEALMGEPQDVEWAYQNNALYLLQTRPVTAAPFTSTPPTPFAFEAPFDAEWTRANHPEVLPELPSPLFTSLMERTQDRGINFFTRMGLNISGLGPYIKCFYGRPYLNLSLIKRVLAQLGFSPIPLLAMAGYVKANTISDPFRINWSKLWQARKPFKNLLGQAFTLGRTVDDYRQTVDEVIARLQKPLPSPPEALQQFKLRERVYGDLIGAGLVLVSALTGLTVLAARLIVPLTASPADAFRTLGTLGKDPATVHHNKTMLQFGRLARLEPAVMAFLTGPPQALEDYRTALHGTQFLVQFEDYLRRYGHRAAYEPDMSQPRLAEQPAALLQTIARYAAPANGHVVAAPTGAAGQSVWQIWKGLAGQTRGISRWLPWRQLLALPLLPLLHKAFGLRNTVRQAEARAMAAIRAWDLKLAHKWVKANLIQSADDYFWLTMEEIERTLVAQKEAGVYLKPAIAARKTAYQTYHDTRAPFVIKDSQVPALTLGATDAQQVLSGTLMGLPVSPGQVQGVVEFLQNVKSPADVPAGIVLVVPSADPMYLPFFPLAAGLIVDRGGMLSHGSIIAREYGLPAVSNIVEARTYLNPGDRVLLDGSTGVVQILEKAARATARPTD